MVATMAICIFSNKMYKRAYDDWKIYDYLLPLTTASYFTDFKRNITWKIIIGQVKCSYSTFPASKLNVWWDLRRLFTAFRTGSKWLLYGRNLLFFVCFAFLSVNNLLHFLFRWFTNLQVGYLYKLLSMVSRLIRAACVWKSYALLNIVSWIWTPNRLYWSILIILSLCIFVCSWFVNFVVGLLIMVPCEVSSNGHRMIHYAGNVVNATFQEYIKSWWIGFETNYRLASEFRVRQNCCCHAGSVDNCKSEQRKGWPTLTYAWERPTDSVVPPTSANIRSACCEELFRFGGAPLFARGFLAPQRRVAAWLLPIAVSSLF